MRSGGISDVGVVGVSRVSAFGKENEVDAEHGRESSGFGFVKAEGFCERSIEPWRIDCEVISK